MNELINDDAVCKTFPATPSLSKTTECLQCRESNLLYLPEATRPDTQHGVPTLIKIKDNKKKLKQTDFFDWQTNSLLVLLPLFYSLGEPSSILILGEAFRGNIYPRV